MLIGDPGTGKSMLARSMTEMLPRDDLQDIIVYHNPEDPNEPKIRVVPAGKGREIVNAQKAEAMQRREQKASMVMTIVFFIIGLSVILSYQWGSPTPEFRPDAPNIILFGILVAAIIYIATRYTGHRQENLMVPKLLVSHTPDEMPPFVDATGSHAGALLGDVKHDPFQSRGLETPAHERVASGQMHNDRMVVLFVHAMNVLQYGSQQSLSTPVHRHRDLAGGRAEGRPARSTDAAVARARRSHPSGWRQRAGRGHAARHGEARRGGEADRSIPRTASRGPDDRTGQGISNVHHRRRDRRYGQWPRGAGRRQFDRRVQRNRVAHRGGSHPCAGEARRPHHRDGSPRRNREGGRRERRRAYQEVHGRRHLEPRHPCPVRRLPRRHRRRQRVHLRGDRRHQRARRGAGQPDCCDDRVSERPRSGPPCRRRDREDRGRGGTRASKGRDPPCEHEGRPAGRSLPGEDRDCPSGHTERGPRGGARGSEEVRVHQHTRVAGPEYHVGQARPGRAAPRSIPEGRWTIRWIPPSSPNRCPATSSAPRSRRPKMTASASTAASS